MKPPEPFVARAATPADAAAVAELVNAFDRAFVEDPDTVEAVEVAGWWKERDALVVHDADGTLAAMGMVKEEGEDVLEGDLFVDQRFVGRGLGGSLLDWLEEEGTARGRPTLRTSALALDTAAGEVIESCGFEPVRHFYRMLVDLDGPPPEPQWPEGFRCSPFRPGEDERALHAVIQESFADHWGFVYRPFDDWMRWNVESHWWDPSLVYLVWAGDEVVAGEINAFRFGFGFVSTLGTLAPWRGRGLGRALLLTAFGEFHRRGLNRVGLGVDAGNETGATQLYESVGMRVAVQADVYEKRV